MNKGGALVVGSRLSGCILSQQDVLRQLEFYHIRLPRCQALRGYQWLELASWNSALVVFGLYNLMGDYVSAFKLHEHESDL